MSSTAIGRDDSSKLSVKIPPHSRLKPVFLLSWSHTTAKRSSATFSHQPFGRGNWPDGVVPVLAKPAGISAASITGRKMW
jgi:hypothetical protein